jgi:hypothetical protein
VQKYLLRERFLDTTRPADDEPDITATPSDTGPAPSDG